LCIFGRRHMLHLAKKLLVLFPLQRHIIVLSLRTSVIRRHPSREGTYICR
jgi:hypothetical protein